jgi:hypothetical protein
MTMRRALLLALFVATCAQAQDAPDVSFKPAGKTEAEVIADAALANKGLGFMLQKLGEGLPWPKSQVVWGEALRIQRECAHAGEVVKKAVEGAATPQEAEAAVASAIPEDYTMAGYDAALADLKKSDPRAKDLVAHMAMLVSISNLQRAAAELRKTAVAKDYAARVQADRSGPWKAAGAELDGVAGKIGPEMGRYARAVQAARVFDAPESL